MNFVDPTTNVHTQNIENRWMRVKTKQKSSGGICRQLLKTYKNLYGVKSLEKSLYKNLSNKICERYPVV